MSILNEFKSYTIPHIPISDFDYSLPREAIAKYPAMPRGTSKLVVIHKNQGGRGPNKAKKLNNFQIEHKHYYNIPDYLNSGDVVVINDTKVIHARLYGRPKGKNSEVEILLLMPYSVGDYKGTKWYALIGGAKKLKNSGGIIEFYENVSGNASLSGDNKKIAIARVLEHLPDGRFILEFSTPAIKLAETIGRVPIPKYMHRQEEELDEEYYQTVVAKKKGAIAAPTASLNLTREILQEMQEKGVKMVYITLYVGWATFAPLREANYLDEFNMPPEYVEISQEAVEIILQAKQQNKQIITFGTTATRTVEGVYYKFGTLKEYSGPVELFITPGYKFQVATGIVTNLHPPLTTPLVLVSSILGIDYTKKLYKDLLKKGYKFYSYGDSMMVLGVR